MKLLVRIVGKTAYFVHTKEFCRFKMRTVATGMSKNQREYIIEAHKCACMNLNLMHA